MQQEKRPAWWWNAARLGANDGYHFGLHGRAWLHHRPRGAFRVEWHMPGRFWHIDLTVGGYDQITFSLAFGLLAFYLAFEDWPWLRLHCPAVAEQGREVSLRVHSGAIWWRLWVFEDAWSSSTPGWRDGCFNIPDFFLGRQRTTRIPLGAVRTMIELPEGAYPATVTLYEQQWRRPRWPWPRRLRRADVDIIGGGAPVPGKGEDAWNCDDSNVSSLTTPATSVEEAVEAYRRSVLDTRERYGGAGWQPATAKP